jgi:hypothetical protein
MNDYVTGLNSPNGSGLSDFVLLGGGGRQRRHYSFVQLHARRFLRSTRRTAVEIG